MARLLLLLVCVLAAGMLAVADARRHHRHHRDTSDPEDTYLKPPPPAFFPGHLPGDGQDVPVPPSPADLFRFVQEGAAENARAGVSDNGLSDLLSGVSGGEDGATGLIKAVYDVLSKKRDMNVAETTKVLTALSDAKQRQLELEQKQDDLKKRAALLLRLQYCLQNEDAEGGSSSGGSSSSSASSGDSSEDEEIKKKEDEIKAKTEEVLKSEQDLQKRVAEVEAREKEVVKREQEVLQRGKELGVEAKKQLADSLDSNKHRSAVQNPLKTAQPVCPGTCEYHQSCGDCTADSKCGWCRGSQKCETAGADRKCAEADWSRFFCASDTCEQHTDCRSCLADPECGLCQTTGKCSKGAAHGPDAGQCPDWSYGGRPMKFFSLNVYGRDMHNATGRAGVLFQMIREANADFVTLQEVEDWFLDALSKEAWAKNYHASDFGSGHAPGGLLVLSKLPLASVAYFEKTQPGQVEVDQRGRVLVVKPRVGTDSFAVATTTLDWRSGDNRADSLDFVFSVLNTTGEAVVTGDFNFDAGSEPESSHVGSGFTDVWSTLRPKQPGFTWDPTTNKYARASDPKSRPSRVDRVLVGSGFNEAVKIDKIGCDAASPHYALVADIKMYGAFC